jgi:hypothetical protein
LVQLRAKPLVLYSQKDACKEFELNDQYRPLNYITSKKQFIDHHDLITDSVTGLMWPKSCRKTPLNYFDAIDHTNHLNQIKFKGFNDWRLPTIEELLSLLTVDKQSNHLFINPLFHTVNVRYWSSDKLAAKTPWGIKENSAWGVDYSFGYVFWSYFHDMQFVKVVRVNH